MMDHLEDVRRITDETSAITLNVNSVNNQLTRSNPEDQDINSSYTDRGSLHSKLVNLYGQDIYRDCRKLDKLRERRAKGIARLTFLKRCRDHNVIPNCIKIKHSLRDNTNKKIFDKASLALLRNQIKTTRTNLDSVNRDLFHIHHKLTATLTQEDWHTIDTATTIQAERTIEKVTQVQKKKFDNLHRNSNTKNRTLPQDKVILNLTSKTLDEATKSVLAKGFNFAVAPRKLPMEEIIIGVESSIKGLPTEVAEEIRQDVSSLVRNSKPPKDNISLAEVKALKKLRTDESIIVLPADKGNATVIMETAEYNNKIKDLLSDDTYSKIRNPTQKIKENINKLIKGSNIPEERKRFLTTSDPTPPILYGLPKIHKEGVPLRPIVSAIGSATHNIARYIARKLQPDVGQTSTYVKNSQHFISILKTLNTSNSDLLVSFDVASLFTKVPIPEVKTIISGLLSPDLAEIAATCLQSTYFYFNGDYYEQKEGAAMGSPLSPVVANLYMEKFEETALASAPLKPKCFLRYVDDCFIIWPHGQPTLESFLNHLNSIHNSIQFTMEIEEDAKLPFLDVLVTRKSDGTLGHQVYRKNTHTDRYLHSLSHHHPSQKQAVIHTLTHRAIVISDSTSLPHEKQHLIRTLEQNGYARGAVIKAFRKHEQQNPPNSEQSQEASELPHKAFLPYVKGTTDRIARILKKVNIRTIFRPHRKLQSYLRPIKDKLHLHTPGVYEIPCSCGQSYIGETGRLIKTRIREHIRDTKNIEIEKSAVALHSYETKHGIKFDEAKIVATSSHYFERKIREAIEIRKNSNNFNKDGGFNLSRSWIPLLNTAKQNKYDTPLSQSRVDVTNTNNNSPSPTGNTQSMQVTAPPHVPPTTSGRYNLRPR